MPSTGHPYGLRRALADVVRAPYRSWRAFLLVHLVCLVCLVAVGGCRPTIVGPTQPSGYRLTLPETSQTQRLHPLSLTVRVTDANGTPLDDVPVHFRIAPPWAPVAEVTPPMVTTRQGQASATFRARTAGQMAVEITVEDHTQAISIAVLGDTPRF